MIKHEFTILESSKNIYNVSEDLRSKNILFTKEYIELLIDIREQLKNILTDDRFIKIHNEIKILIYNIENILVHTNIYRTQFGLKYISEKNDKIHKILNIIKSSQLSINEILHQLNNTYFNDDVNKFLNFLKPLKILLLNINNKITLL